MCLHLQQIHRSRRCWWSRNHTLETPGEGITGGQGTGRMVRQMFQVMDWMEGKKERKDLGWMGCCPLGRRCGQEDASILPSPVDHSLHILLPLLLPLILLIEELLPRVVSLLKEEKNCLLLCSSFSISWILSLTSFSLGGGGWSSAAPRALTRSSYIVHSKSVCKIT